MKATAFFPVLSLLFLASCGKKQESVFPLEMPLTEAVYASGNIVPNDEFRLFSQGDGQLVRKLIQEGDSVSVGQVIFELESVLADSRAEAAEGVYELAALNASGQSPVLAELESAQATLKRRVSQDSLNAIRFRDLFQKQAVPKIELEKAELTYAASLNELRAMNSRLLKARKQVNAEFANARSQVTISRTDRSYYSVKSPRSGVLYDVLKEEGELVRRGEPLAIMGVGNQTALRLFVDELDAARVKAGQEVMVKVDAYPGKVFRAKVVKVYPLINQMNQSVKVDASWTDLPPGQMAGMTAEANIILSKKDKALCIPRSYLLEGDSVWVKQDGELLKKGIKTGAADMEWVEITSGIGAETAIFKK